MVTLAFCLGVSAKKCAQVDETCILSCSRRKKKLAILVKNLRRKITDALDLAVTRLQQGGCTPRGASPAAKLLGRPPSTRFSFSTDVLLGKLRPIYICIHRVGAIRLPPNPCLHGQKQYAHKTRLICIIHHSISLHYCCSCNFTFVLT